MSTWAKVSIALAAMIVIGFALILNNAFHAPGRLQADQLRAREIRQASDLICSYARLCGALPEGIATLSTTSCVACKMDAECSANVVFLTRMSKADLSYGETQYKLTEFGAHLHSDPDKDPKSAGLPPIDVDVRCTN